jgi:hypothetical protein
VTLLYIVSWHEDIASHNILIVTCIRDEQANCVNLVQSILETYVEKGWSNYCYCFIVVYSRSGNNLKIVWPSFVHMSDSSLIHMQIALYGIWLVLTNIEVFMLHVRNIDKVSLFTTTLRSGWNVVRRKLVCSVDGEWSVLNVRHWTFVLNNHIFPIKRLICTWAEVCLIWQKLLMFKGRSGSLGPITRL